MVFVLKVIKWLLSPQYVRDLYEYMTIGMATIGTLSMVSAVGAIETNQWLLGASAVTLGITSYALSLYSQILYSEAQ